MENNIEDFIFKNYQEIRDSEDDQLFTSNNVPRNTEIKKEKYSGDQPIITDNESKYSKVVEIIIDGTMMSGILFIVYTKPFKKFLGDMIPMFWEYDEMSNRVVSMKGKLILLIIALLLYTLIKTQLTLY